MPTTGVRKMVGEDQEFTSRSKVDLARLPPCQCALNRTSNA